MKPIRVLVVDDSPLVRQWLIKVINGADDMKVVETASDGRFVVSKVREYRPDVITLDINMPKMNGLTALKHLMLSYPSRVLIVSSLADTDAVTTMQALQLGALDFITKPLNLKEDGLNALNSEVLKKIRAASRVNPADIRYSLKRNMARTPLQRKNVFHNSRFEKLVVIGSSTGGPAALEDILMRLPYNFPYPLIIAQHIPRNFTKSFLKALNDAANLNVKIIGHDEYISAGNVYIAPGGFNLRLEQDERGVYGKLTKVNEDYGIVSPSVDQLFKSAAQIKGRDIIACLLTGLGNDGTEGIKEIYENKGITIAQDQESSMVYSMPEHAIAAGYIQHIMSLGRIPDFLVAKSLKGK
jgi:two-component system chemotaxis response regulator CheB